MVFLRIALLFCFMAALSAAASSEQLPIKTYTTADGLARDNVSRIFQDSRGFLWFCTVDGLSRFDGYKFTRYDADQGLPHRVVNDLLETRGGIYWVATGDGLVRFNPTGTQSRDARFGTRDVNSSNPQSAIRNPQSSEPTFDVYRPEGYKGAWGVKVLMEDRAGVIWCGTNQGLYRLEQVDGRWALGSVDIGMPTNVLEADEVNSLLEDRHGALWVGSESGLYRRWPDGRAERHTTRRGSLAAGTPPLNSVRALSEDAEGRLWAGTGFGLCRIATDPRPGQSVVAELYTLKDGLTNNFVNTLLESADGTLWIGTRYGLSEFVPDAGDGRPKFRGYTAAQGLSDVAVRSLAEDRAGNLWLGTETGGVMKIARNGFTSYQEVDGLGYPRVNSIFENGAGELYVVNGFSDAGGSDKLFISRFDGGRGFTSVRPNLPARINNVGWGWGQISFQDRAGEWWVTTGEGLCRFPKVGKIEDLARTPPKRIYTTRDGLPADEVFRLFEDSRGDIWISTLGNPEGMLTRWERSTETFHRYPPAAGGVPKSAPSAFGEDRSGNLWIGFYDGGLLRYRDNRFTLFTTRDGVPAGFVRGIHVDGAGRLWVATSEGGLGRLDDPAAERLRFVTYTTAEGLTSNFVTCVTEDRWGRIYVGTGRGVDRLDPATGRVKNYTTADGLVNNYVNVAFRDRHGNLWFGTYQGPSRLVPEPARARLPPPVQISGLRIAGVPYPVSDLGETAVSNLELGPGQNRIQIDFFGLSFSAGEALRYQYKIEGLKQDWSQPSNQRAVDINLSPGTYRFLVRAVDAEGTISPAPAAVAFTILPPVWQRWWFLALTALAVGAVVVSVERYRAARMRELNAALGRSEKLTEVLTEQRAELRKANRSLELEYAATSVLAGHTTLAAIRPRLLQAICEHTDWEVGTLWEVDEGARVLRCLDTWHQPHAHAPQFEGYSREFVRASGEGLPGRVWESGEPYWITDLAAGANSPRIKFAVGEGLKSAFGVPILLEAEVIGVLEFFSREARRPDEEQLKMLSAIGNHVGQLIERKRAEEELRCSREERLRELERVRTRIATDLHDDIGSSLTQIVILSEVAHQQAARHDGAAAGPLSLITGISNELVEAMSDIVWAINPRKDHLSDLAFRMRRFASDLFTARGVKFHFHAPDLERDVRLGANVRREVFLIFKESVNNIVKHAACTEAHAEFHIADGRLTLRLRDNGRGFDLALVAGGGNGSDAAAGRGGNGLPSMRKRAEELGGTFEVTTGAGRGTAVVLSVPVEHQASGAEEVATRVGGDARVGTR